MEPDQLARALEAVGCPAQKSLEMASQLEKRARQLAEQRKQSYDDAMLHLLQLMKQGWAAPSTVQESDANIRKSE
jgi:hypothetical protein